MAEQEMGTMILHYTDGTEERFEYARASGQEAVNIGAAMQEGLKANQLIIELADRTLIIPMQGLKMIEVCPSPVRLPMYAIRNAQLLEHHTVES